MNMLPPRTAAYSSNPAEIPAATPVIPTLQASRMPSPIFRLKL